MKRTYFAIAILMLLFAAGCATLQQRQATAYKILATTASIYDTSMKSLRVLYDQGLLTEEEKQMAIQAGLVFWTAWHEAEIAVEIWFATEDPAAENRALVLIDQLQKRFSEMMEILRPLLARATA